MNIDVAKAAVLAEDPRSNVRAAVAENPNCPSDILYELENDRDIEVLNRLAINPNLPSDIKDRLMDRSRSTDYGWYLELGFADNPNLLEGDYNSLARSQKAEVRERLAINPSCPSGALLLLIEKSSENDFEFPDTLCQCLQHPNCPSEVLLGLLRESGNYESQSHFSVAIIASHVLVKRGLLDVPVGRLVQICW